MSKIHHWLSGAIAAGAIATSASADTQCGAQAIPRGSIWFLQVQHSGSTVCEVRFNTLRGGFAGPCFTYEQDQFGDPLVVTGTISGRLVINNSCGFTGTATHTSANGSDALTVNGALSGAGRAVAESPSMGSGVLSNGEVVGEGFPVLLEFSLVRRTRSTTFPSLRN